LLLIGAVRNTRDDFSAIYGIAKSCCGRGSCRIRRSLFQGGFGTGGSDYSTLGCISRPGPMDRAPGRIGFMSTQRRANRLGRINRTEREKMMERTSSAFGTRFRRATANGVTAPLMSIIWLAWASLLQSGAEASRGALDGVATNSLLSDHRFRTLARLDCLCGSPPLNAAGHSGNSATPANHWSSKLHIPRLSFRARLHQSLPHAPAGTVRWAERYDGKGNLHIQHTA
jgi:hypothetical protein